MMDSKTLEKIEDLVKSSLSVQKIDEIEYSATKLHKVEPPKPDVMETLSLGSLIDFAKLLDEETRNASMFHVESPTCVSIALKSWNKHGERNILGCADVTEHMQSNFDYGSEYSHEEFIVAIQTAFEETPTRAQLMDAISKVSINEDDEIEDDGFTQKVSAKKGVHLKSMVSMPNPVILKPYKTFPEIEPKEEPFILRVSKDRHQKEPRFKLYNTKSLVWEIEMVADIKEYLTKNGSLVVV